MVCHNQAIIVNLVLLMSTFRIFYGTISLIWLVLINDARLWMKREVKAAITAMLVTVVVFFFFAISFHHSN